MAYVRVLVLALGVVAGPTAGARGDDAAHAAPCEAPHIQAHLERVEAELLAADTSRLSPAQRARRAHHIAVLREYREACVFPRNTIAPGRITPVFVDERGVHCAVGYLMAQDGRGDLVEKVRSTRNTATIQELAGDPGVDAWLREAGLSWFEAARIQPEYCLYTKAECLCSEYGYPPSGASAIARGVIASVSPTTLRVTAVFGDSDVASGDVIDVAPIESDEVGREALVLLDDAPAGRTGTQTVSGDSVSCRSGTHGGQASVKIPVQAYVDALMAEDCYSALVAYDARLGQSVCTGGDVVAVGGGGGGGGGSGGCNGGAAPSVLAGLLLAALWARSRRRVHG